MPTRSRRSTWVPSRSGTTRPSRPSTPTPSSLRPTSRSSTAPTARAPVFVWTDYLTKVSAEWQTKVGTSKNPQWPVGQGGKGNEGVTNAVKQTPNAIGYVELNYAIINKLPFADVKNKAGKFVTPSIDSTSAAAAGVTLPADYRVSIVNADGDAAYPIASFTYLLVYKTSGSCSKQTPLVNFLWWVFHDAAAASTAKELDYAPIPAKALPQIEATIKSLKCDGGSKTSLTGG